MTLSSADLCKGLPNEIFEFLEYCRSLSFDKEPNYKYLKQLLKKISRNDDFDIYDSEFDWDENRFK